MSRRQPTAVPAGGPAPIGDAVSERPATALVDDTAVHDAVIDEEEEAEEPVPARAAASDGGGWSGDDFPIEEYDELLVSVHHRFACRLEQQEPVAKRQLPLLAVRRDGLALDELHHEVRRLAAEAVADGAAVDQTRDGRVRQPGEDLPLQAQPFEGGR